MEETCCMKDCTNNVLNETLFNFPTNINQCITWIQNCGRLEFFEEFSYLGACAFVTRRICSVHFKRTDFINPLIKSLGLTDGAIPEANYPRYIQETMEDPLNNIVGNINLTDHSHAIFLRAMKIEADDCITELNPITMKNDVVNSLLIPTDGQSEYQKINGRKGKRKRKIVFNTKIQKDQKLQRQMKREAETPEQVIARKLRNQIRSEQRHNESPEQRAERKLKDIIRSARRRHSETELQRQIRRYNDAVRAAYRRSTESEEQRERRKMIDVARAAKRRSMENPEQREARLQSDRLRAAKRRMVKRLRESSSEISTDDNSFSNTDGLPLNDFQSKTLMELKNRKPEFIQQVDNINDLRTSKPNEQQHTQDQSVLFQALAQV